MEETTRSNSLELQKKERTFQFFELPDRFGIPSHDLLDQIPQLFGCKELEKERFKNLEKLHIVANLLLVSANILEKLRDVITRYDEEALATSDAAHIRGFYVVSTNCNKDEEEFLQGNNKVRVIDHDDVAAYEDCIEIKSTKGKATFLQLFPFINSKNLLKDFHKHRTTFNEYMRDNNNEVALIAKNVKNVLAQKLRAISIIGIASSIFYPLLFIEKKPDIYSWQDAEELMKEIPNDATLYAHKDFYAILEEWLVQRDILPLVEKCAPHALWTYKFINALTAYIKLFGPDNKEIFLKPENECFSYALKQATGSLSSIENYSEKLYKKIMEMRTAVLGTFTSKKDKLSAVKKYGLILLNAPPHGFYRMPPLFTLKTKVISYNGHYNQNLLANKRVVKKGKKEKKPRRRHNKKKQLNNEVTQELQKEKEPQKKSSVKTLQKIVD